MDGRLTIAIPRFALRTSRGKNAMAGSILKGEPENRGPENGEPKCRGEKCRTWKTKDHVRIDDYVKRLHKC